MQSSLKETLIRGIIQGFIIAAFLFIGLGMFADKVVKDHEAIRADMTVIHNQIFDNTANRNVALAALTSELNSAKGQILANQAMVGERFERMISQMLLLEAKQEKENAIVIDMRARCQK